MTYRQQYHAEWRRRNPEYMRKWKLAHPDYWKNYYHAKKQKEAFNDSL